MLFRGRRFTPLFIVQFMGAFNDNIYRSALLFLIGFGKVPLYGADASMIAPLSLAFFIMPFFLFSALAGELADKVEKSRFIIFIKIWELILMVLAFFAYMVNDLMFLITILCGLGMQSAFFGPVKFSIIPPLVGENKLLAANGYIDAGTFLAILLGALAGASLISLENGRMFLSVTMISVSVAGLVAAFFIPRITSAASAAKISKNPVSSTLREVRLTFKDPVLALSISGAAWVWLLGSVYLSQIPVLAPDVLKASEAVFTLLLALFSLGVGFGSVMVTWLLKGEITNKLAAKALSIIVICSVGFYGCLSFYQPPQAGLGFDNLADFPVLIIAFVLLFLIAVSGGVVIVPLYTIMQSWSSADRRSRVMATNNIVNAGFMATGSVLSAIMAGVGLSSTVIITLTGLTGVFLIMPLKRLTKIMAKGNSRFKGK